MMQFFRQHYCEYVSNIKVIAEMEVVKCLRISLNIVDSLENVESLTKELLLEKFQILLGRKEI